jgi:guanosine-3',5'-bis(diphosphate) 3'-pyrophosphohydrolase
VVKAADVMDNLDLGHISHPTEQDYARLKEYAQVKALLAQAAAAEPGH